MSSSVKSGRALSGTVMGVFALPRRHLGFPILSREGRGQFCLTDCFIFVWVRDQLAKCRRPACCQHMRHRRRGISGMMIRRGRSGHEGRDDRDLRAVAARAPHDFFQRWVSGRCFRIGSGCDGGVSGRFVTRRGRYVRGQQCLRAVACVPASRCRRNGDAERSSHKSFK